VLKNSHVPEQLCACEISGYIFQQDNGLYTHSAIKTINSTFISTSLRQMLINFLKKFFQSKLAVNL